MDPVLRASDDDRRRVVAALERHTAAGRLRLDEFETRVTAAFDAVTLGDLARITHDLPVDVDAHRPSHQLFYAFLLAVITLLVLGVVLALTR
jgi:hypothetical protein